MAARLAADMVLLLHAGFIVFVAAGGLLVLRWKKAAWLHVPCVLWGVWIELTGRICPLTPLENWLRLSAGGTGYSGGFIEHYLLPVIYPVALTRATLWAIGAAAVVLNLCVYGLVVLHRSAKNLDRNRAPGGRHPFK